MMSHHAGPRRARGFSVAMLVTFGALVGLVRCQSTSATSARDGLDPSSIPEPVRDDYDTFARRCSKCHALSRPLNSGIDDDAYWAEYVTRMRRQPASGISTADEVKILRFLHYYSARERRAKTTDFVAPDGGGED